MVRITEHIVQIEESEKNISERFVGQLRSYPELIRCKGCKFWSGEYHSCMHHDNGIDWDAEDYCSMAERKTE